MDIFDRIASGAGDRGATARHRADLAAHGRRGPGALASVGLAALAAAAGAAAAFLLDPARGRARRARVLDQGSAIVRRAGRRATQAVHRVQSDVAGKVDAMQAARSPDAKPLDDATLTDRVHSIAFRDPSLPKGSLNINVERGIVVIRGEVPDDASRQRLLDEVRGVEGVWSVRDLTHLPGEEAATARTAS
jgi:osmotically-inducible protein OsmY